MGELPRVPCLNIYPSTEPTFRLSSETTIENRFLFHDDANLSKFRKILRNDPRPVIFVEEGRISRSGKKTRVLSLIFEFYGEKKIIRCINSVTNTTTISGNDHLSSENSRPRDIES